MKIFHWFGKEKPKRSVPDSDKLWVDRYMQEMLDVFGAPMNETILFNASFFPNTFAEATVSSKSILKDLCNHLQLDASKFQIELVGDSLKDMIPVASEGPMFESELEYANDSFILYLGEQVTQHVGRLVNRLTKECVKAKLMLEGKDYQYTEPELVPYIFLAGIYFGFGVLLTQHITEKGQRIDGDKVKHWYFVPDIHIGLLEYILAYYAKLSAGNSTDWIAHLPEGVHENVRDLVDSMHDFQPPIIPEDFPALKLLQKSSALKRRNEFVAAIGLLKEALELTSNLQLKSTLNNNIGYWYLFLEEYETSTEYFKKAIECDTDFAYPYDNLGYALIRLGRIEEGKIWLDKALSTPANEYAYSERNMALYHLAKGEIGQAEICFRNSFENQGDGVDFLEFHYAEYLLSIGKNEEGVEYLKMAVNKKEPIAVKLLASILS